MELLLKKSVDKGNEMCKTIIAERTKDMTYQELFNQTLSKMRYATSGALVDNEPLMRALVKIMYDFSDDLKRNKIIIERTNDNGMDKNTNNSNN